MLPELWVVLVCTALTLFFSVAHYTLRNPSRVRLEQAFAGRQKAHRLGTLDTHLDVLLLATATVRVVAHLVLLLALLYMFDARHDWLADLGALALAGVIVMIFGIGIPHAWAKYAGERTVAASWPVLMAALYCFWPIARALAAMDVPIRRLSGAEEREANHKTTVLEQEILQLASEGQAEGVVNAEEMEMIESVIEFGDRRAGEIMTPRTDIVAVEAGATLEQCRQIVIEAGHSRIPVYEETQDKIIGVLYAKDLLNAGLAPSSFNLHKVMRKAFFVPETKSLGDLLREFRGQKVHMAIVLDEYGGTAGLVTIEDLLEQIVGEIADEYEPAEPAMLHRVDDRTVEVDARIYIDDLNDELDLALPEDADYDTVAGFILSTLGYIPKAGEQLQAGDIRFTIIDADPRKINRVRLELPQPTSGQTHPA